MKYIPAANTTPESYIVQEIFCKNGRGRDVTVL